MIKVQVTGNIATVTERPRRITSGTVGLPVEFTFDSQWDGLTKVVMFRAGEVTQTIYEPAEGTVVPWEVLEKPDVWLCIGAYGVNAEGTVVIPTIWVNVAVIYNGVNHADDPALRPTLPVWQEMKEMVTAAQEAMNGHIANADNPHNITAEQLGLGAVTQMQEAIAALQSAVIAQGQTDAWSWSKRLDGTAECRMIHTGNITDLSYAEAISLPFVFMTVQETTITLCPETQVALQWYKAECANQSGPTTENATTVEIRYFGPDREGSVVTEIWIRGTWR